MHIFAYANIGLLEKRWTNEKLIERLESVI